MNNDVIEGKWNQMKGSAQAKWGKLTNDDLDQIQGNRTKLAGKIQEAYGKSKDEVEKELKEWEKTFAA